jgi:hypothetical protein
MNFGRRLSEKCATATLAQNDETFTGSSQRDDWLRKAAVRFRSAMTLQVPVGYEDEAGFHYGHERGYEPQRILTTK